MDTKRTLIGTCEITDIDKFKEWLIEEGYRRESSIFSSGLHGGWFDDNWRTYFYDKQQIFSMADHGMELVNIFNDAVTDAYRSKSDSFFRFITYLASINQKLEVYYTDDFATLAGFGKLRFVLPTKWLVITPYQDYSYMSASQLKAIGSVDEASDIMSLSVQEDSTANEMYLRISKQKDKISDLDKDMEDVRNAKTNELAALQAEIDKKMEELNKLKEEKLAELMQKREQLEAMKKEYEKQLFLLETQIYGIRCYLGEVVNFCKLVEGKEAPVEEPVVLYQKIRYLDEELGKALAIYQIDGKDKALFVEILKAREDIRDYFAPGSKSISFIKISRTRTAVKSSEVIENYLETYEKYHANQLAMLVKNGENLHIAWLDEDKISIFSEDVYLTPERKVEEMNEDNQSLRSTSGNEFVSRYFVFSLLQGVFDNSDLIKFPENVSLVSNSPYIIYSTAEGWISDNRYGSFSEICERISHLPMKEGDMVITLMSIGRDDRYNSESRYRRFNNDRGIGYKNRTHDVAIGECVIQPINKIITTCKFMIYYRDYKVIISEDGKEQITDEIVSEDHQIYSFSENEDNSDISHRYLEKKKRVPKPEEVIKYFQQSYGRESDRIYGRNDNAYVRDYYKIELVNESYQYYLSVMKSDSRLYDKKASYANLEFMQDEVMPLTYLNSTWIKYVITTGNIGDWRINGTRLSYADALYYLNHMLPFLAEREKTEKENLTAAGLSDWVREHPDWPAIVGEWKIRMQVRNLTEYQAKRFAKSFK